MARGPGIAAEGDSGAVQDGRTKYQEAAVGRQKHAKTLLQNT